MAITTYSELQAALATRTKRSDLTDLIPEFIAFTEARANRELRVSNMLTRATDTIEDEFVAVPVDFLSPKSMRLTASPYTLLNFRSVEQISDLRAKEQATGDPTDYARIGGQFWFYPPQDTPGVEVELIYYAAIPALSETNTTNWLLTAAPDVYVWGALLEAAIYTEDPEQQNTFATLFQAAIDKIGAAEKRDAFAANLTPTPSTAPQ